MSAAADVDRDLSSLLSRDEWPLRWQRKLHLLPNSGMGLARRALLYALVTWVPVAAWALLTGHALPGHDAEPLITHFGITVRCLVAIPLFVLAEGSVLRATVNMVRQFIQNGLVTEAQLDKFATLLRVVARLRDSSLPWVILFGLVLSWTIVNRADPTIDALSWAEEPTGSLGFGGWWFAYIARPVFLALVLGWLWRIVLILILFSRIATLDLSLVPTHPDRAGGLGFLEMYPGAFALVTLALSAVIGSGWAHDIVFHGERVESLTPLLAAFAVVWSLIVLSPLLVFAPTLMAAKRQAKMEYSRVVGEHGRNVRRRWVLNEPVDDEALDPPGIGPIADAVSLYDAVIAMRFAPIGKASLIAILVPLLVPMIAVFAIQIPVKTLLMQLFKALM